MKIAHFKHAAISGLAGLFLLLSTNQAMAAKFSCTGSLTYFGFFNSGTVVVSINDQGVWTICSTNGTWNGVNAAACKNWYGALLTAHSTQREVTLYFDTTNSANSSLAPNDCSEGNMGDWVGRPPYFLHARN
ncbi:MAG: hypothetical protein AAGI28_12945 [Pseudomonadota bacterium]